ncbi:hypothetical protein ACIA03_07805 [Nocardioides sp. NPDC051685]|uniref:hypothetical protein n=1 Tax=Nocardioides sp. NPDC051685 TaxID=3364334 RepID=UPI0037895E19
MRHIKTVGFVAAAGGAIALGRAVPRLAEIIRATRILDSVDTGSVWTTRADEPEHAVRVGSDDHGPE